MCHLMIDLETLGTEHNAPIVSIGAVFFDPDTGELGPEFHEKIDFTSACEGREISPDTVKWWLTQSDGARRALVSGDLNTRSNALNNFVDFVKYNCKVNNVRPWGNGATFDISMIESNMKDLGITPPWKFWNIRDVRTIVDCASELVDKKALTFSGVQHDALDDAKHQAKYISKMWQALRA